MKLQNPELEEILRDCVGVTAVRILNELDWLKSYASEKTTNI